MATLTKRQLNKIDKQVEAAFYRHGTGVVINIFDLSKIMNAGREAVIAGRDVDEAVKGAIEAVRTTYGASL